MRPMSRRKVAVVVVLAVVVSAVGGWSAASRVRSPSEIAAETAPPDASPILVAVEERTLTSEVVSRGTGRFGSPQQLTIAPSALKPAPGIVTTLATGGTQLDEGAVALVAAGRPVFLLSGYRLGVRDLGPGMEGEDVRQLEDALLRLGFDPGPVDGIYDTGTESGVTAWYEAAGFAPFRATEDQLASIRSREADLAQARVDLFAAEESTATAEAELATAVADHADALAAQSASPVATAAAQVEADAANLAAQAEVTQKQAALDELVASGEASASAIAAAQAELDAAVANATSVQAAGEQLVAEALVAATAADNAVVSTQAAVSAAQQNVVIAGAAASSQGTFTDFAALEAGLALRQAGVQVPADEVVYVPTTPVRVNELQVGPGDPLEGPVMTATDAVVAIDGGLALEDASLVHAGTPVQIDETDLGIDATGTISQVAATPGTNGADGFHIWFEVIVDGAPPNIAGASVRLTVPVESTSGRVLAVPTSAVSLAADGSSRVEWDDNGRTSFVPVEPGLSADGFVEVTPIDGRLEAGDLVVVGVNG